MARSNRSTPDAAGAAAPNPQLHGLLGRLSIYNGLRGRHSHTPDAEESRTDAEAWQVLERVEYGVSLAAPRARVLYLILMGSRFFPMFARAAMLLVLVGTSVGQNTTLISLDQAVDLALV